MLETLRGVGIVRPAIDGAVALRVRAELEATVGPSFVPSETLTVTKARLRQVLVCERHLVALLRAPDPRTPELVAGRLLDHLFGLVAVGQPLGADLVADALGAAAAAGEGTDAWEALTFEEQADAAGIVERSRPALAAWPLLPGSAVMRLQDPLLAELAGGRVVLSGRADLVLGQPGPTVVGTTLVDVKSGKRRHSDAVDAGWYAVLETLRHGAPPFQVGSYYLRDGELSLVLVTPELISQATARIAQGLRRLVVLAQGAVPTATPNPLCPWCPAISTCEPGRRLSDARGDLIGPVSVDDL